MFINRDWNLSEEEDFKKNVAPQMTKHQEATPVYSEEMIVGWFIRNLYE